MVSCFIDSDIILDHILDREPFSKDTGKILSLAENRKIKLFTSAIVLSNVFFLIRKSFGNKRSIQLIDQLLELIDVIPVGKREVISAIKGGFLDFEDGLQNAAAENKNIITTILTRNIKDYKQSNLSVVPPKEFLSMQ